MREKASFWDISPSVLLKQSSWSILCEASFLILTKAQTEISNAEDPIQQFKQLPIGDSPRTFATTAWALLLGLVTGVFAFGVSFLTIFQHLVQYNSPKKQKFIVRILMVIPIYSVLSLLCLIVPSFFLYLEVFRDIWEAAVIYFFGQLILVYCGGESTCAHMIQQNPGAIKHQFPISLCFRKEIPLDPGFVKAAKRAMLQFVIIKPLMGVTSIIVFACGGYDSILWRLFEGIVYNLCYSWALYYLVLFYVATRHHPGLKGSQPVRKFVAVKIIVFATFWQSFFLQFVPGLTNQELRAWVNFILLLEMPFFSILQVWAFPIREFNTVMPDLTDDSYQDWPRDVGKELEMGVSDDSTAWEAPSPSPTDQIDDLPTVDPARQIHSSEIHGAALPIASGTEPQRQSEAEASGSPELPDSYVKGIGTSIARVPRKLFPKELKNQIASVADPDQRSKALVNVMEAVNINDIVTDAYYNFNKKYQGHAMMENDEENQVMEDVEVSPVPAITPRGFNPQYDTDFVTEERQLRSEVRPAGIGRSNPPRHPRDMYFNTNVPGFTDHTVDVHGHTNSFTSAPTQDIRRKSDETTLPGSITRDHVELRRDSRRISQRGLGSFRSCSDDGTFRKWETRQQDYWAEGEPGWGGKHPPQTTAPKWSLPAPPTTRRESKEPHFNASQRENTHVAKLKKVIGRPIKHARDPRFVLMHMHDDYESDPGESTGRRVPTSSPSVNAPVSSSPPVESPDSFEIQAENGL
eukprot:GHVN01034547.1.p1 GENE.GHVN01034547.1~~GHVN01034547.1.p1  ORF type:complete len:748 (+),score=49.37 GHVN01034547.1:2452-4695(+)